MFNTSRHIMESLQESYFVQSQKIVDQLAAYFKYFKEELTPIKEVYTSFEQIAQKFKNKQAKLYTRKEKLFGEQNLKAWEVTLEDLKAYAPQQLASNKELAMTLILPKVLLVMSYMHSRKPVNLKSTIRFMAII